MQRAHVGLHCRRLREWCAGELLGGGHATRKNCGLGQVSTALHNHEIPIFCPSGGDTCHISCKTPPLKDTTTRRVIFHIGQREGSDGIFGCGLGSWARPSGSTCFGREHCLYDRFGRVHIHTVSARGCALTMTVTACAPDT